MQFSIYINGYKVDTDEKTKVSETKQINDFFEIKDRQTSYTNAISLPMTDRNKWLFEMMGVAGNTSLVPYRRHTVIIEREGIQTVQDGIGKFKPTTDRYNLYVYSENINLFEAMGNKSIGDLQLSALTHVLDVQKWKDSFTRNDYVYPVADYGKTFGNTIEVNYQVPALYVKYLWDKIFQENGFKYKYVGRGGRQDYNPFIDSEWEELAITIDEGFPKLENTGNAIKVLDVNKVDVIQLQKVFNTYFGVRIPITSPEGEAVEYVRFNVNDDPVGLHRSGANAQYNFSRVRIKEDGFYRINAFGEFNNLGTENSAMYVEKEGVNIFTINDSFPELQSDFGINETIYLKAGEELLFKIVALPKEGEIYYSYDLTVQMFLDNTTANVNFNGYLSKLKQKDFIKDVMHHFGLVPRRIGDTYEFICLNELLDPTARYKIPIEESDVLTDWSSKFHVQKSDATEVGSYAQSNRFSFKYDNQADSYADGILKVDDHTLDLEKGLIQRPYRAPKGSVYSIGQQLARCEFYETSLNDDGSIKDVKGKKVTPYFFKVNKRIESFDYKIAGASGSSTYTGLTPFATFEGLTWASILPERYSAFANTINYGHKITAQFHLSVIDIHTLDFFKLVYVKQLGGIYYLNKVSGFSGTGITDVELVKIRSFEKLGQFSNDFNNDFNN